jgi:hypothetical protein
MATAYIKAVVQFYNLDGLPADQYTNQFHYMCFDGVDSAGATSALETFYNTINGGAAEPVAYYLSHYISRTVLPTVKYTDVTAHLNGAPSGPPFAEDTFTSLAASANTTSLPNQDMATLSYYDARDSEGTTKGDHRGRIFLGPLDRAALAYGTGGPLLLDDVGVTLTDSLEALEVQLASATPTKTLTVWSRKDAVMRAAIGCFSNNDVSTLRKRAYAATSRHTVVF